MNIIYSLFLAFYRPVMTLGNLLPSKAGAKEIRIFFLYFIVFSVIALALGWPRPNRDDMIFIGTPIHYLAGGNFENPYCSYFLEQLGTIRHLYYVPGHAILLTGWLKLWGVSAVSFVAFTVLCWWIGGWSLFLILTRHVRWHTWPALVAVTHYLFVMSMLGLRPDSAGWGCMLAGICLLLGERRRWQIAGYVLTVGSVLIAPVCFAVVIPVYVYLLIKDPKRLKTLLLTCTLASVLFAGLAGFFIDFDYAEFYRVFTRHIGVARFRGYTRTDYLVQFFTTNMYAVLRLPFYTLALLLLLYGCYRRNAFMAVLLAVALLSYWMYPPYALENVHLIIALVTLLYSLGFLKRLQYNKVGGLLAVLLLGAMNLVFLITNIFQVNEVVLPPVPERTFTAAYVCGDAFAARYIYDYKLPSNFKSLDFYRYDFAPEGFYEQRPDEVWIFGAIYPYRMNDNREYDIPVVKIGNIPFRSIVLYPNYLYIRKP